MKLSQRERRFVQHYQGLPAKEIARVERLRVHEVFEIWDTLRARGVVRRAAEPAQGPACERLSFDSIDRMMRGNRAPVEPDNHEIGWTPDTEGSW